MRVTVGKLPNGKPDRRSITGKSKRDVQIEVRKLLAERDAGRMPELAKSKDSVATYLNTWLGTLPGRVKDSTVVRYRNLINRHMIPGLGHIRLSELKSTDIATFYAERLASGLSSTTVVLIHTTVRKALSDAVTYQYIGANPAEKVTPPRRAAFDPRVPTASEVQRLIDAAYSSKDRLAGLWTILARSGARIGELLALKWEAVSWERDSIAITSSLSVDAKKRPIITAPKTSRGKRVISLDRAAMEALKRHRAQQNVDKLRLGPAYADDGLVFASEVGTLLSERNVIREFKEALQRAGFSDSDRERIRIHDLRHFHITEAAHAGVSIKALSARAGHASVAFTLDRYAHAIEAGDREVAEAVAGRLAASDQQSQDGHGSSASTGTDPR